MPVSLTRIDELVSRPLSDELIPGLLDDGLILTVGSEGVGKTFFSIHTGVQIASGKRWRDRAVRRGAVIYCIAEGVSFFPYRVTTAFDAIGADAAGQPFYVLDRSFNLRTNEDGTVHKDVEEFAIAVAALADKCQFDPRLVIFDTLNRYMPGGDENKQKDAGALINGCEWLRHSLGCAVMLMHHTRKGGDMLRGSTVLAGAADQVIYSNGPKGNLTEAPTLWTTKGGIGKRKDRDPVEQWFQFKTVAMTRGNLSILRRVDEDDWTDPDEVYVLREEEDAAGMITTSGLVEDTLIMEPVAPPAHSGHSGLDGQILEALQGGPLGVRALWRVTGANTSRLVYKALDDLHAAGKVTQDDKKRWTLVEKPNPFVTSSSHEPN